MSPVALRALAVTLAVEVPIVALFYRRRWLTMALVCALTTGMTNCFMNTTWRSLIPDHTVAITLGEIGAFGIEGAVYLLFDKAKDVRRALAASAVANAASFTMGFVL